MTWYMAGAAALTATTSLASGIGNRNSAINNLNAQTRAEGDAVVRDRLNQTIRNSYSTALGQMQLGLKRKQAAQQGADISAAGLAAHGNADVAAAATGSIGASTAAVASDIDQKVQQALDQNAANFENALEAYNTDLQLMVMNTDQSAPVVRRAEYTGPSDSEILGGAVMQGLSQFAGNYAMRAMKLNLGKPQPASLGSGLNINNPSGLGLKWR